MDLGIAGRVALVTGSSAGIGYAAADALAREGCDVALNARGEDRLEAAAAEIRRHGGRVLAVPGDVGDASDVSRVLEVTRSELGDPDILVTNAGGPPSGTFTEMDDDAWDAAYRTTLLGAVRLARNVLPAMREQGWGRILNVTSFAVLEPVHDIVLSNAFRSALTAAAKTLAEEVGPDGVTVNNVAPGYTRTQRMEELDRDLDRVIARIPLRRLAEPREVGDVIAFLASERASYVTGRTLAVEGGALKSW